MRYRDSPMIHSGARRMATSFGLSPCRIFAISGILPLKNCAWCTSSWTHDFMFVIKFRRNNQACYFLTDNKRPFRKIDDERLHGICISRQRLYVRYFEMLDMTRWEWLLSARSLDDDNYYRATVVSACNENCRLSNISITCSQCYIWHAMTLMRDQIGNGRLFWQRESTVYIFNIRAEHAYAHMRMRV